jgi:hypothetical protein
VRIFINNNRQHLPDEKPGFMDVSEAAAQNIGAENLD